MAKKILITGASAGFGSLMVKSLLADGHTVTASMRAVEGKNAENAKAAKEAGAHVVELDVTSEESVNAGIGAGAEAMGGLDVVVNNAGVGVLGWQAFNTEDWQKLFDVNVFGVQRVNRAAIPLCESKVLELIIYISSLFRSCYLPLLWTL